MIVVDPPRKGCDETLLETIVKMQPEKVVYVSCDSATLARDLKYLCANGYEITVCRGVDQFPQSVHVETVVLLSQLKQKPDDYINVTIELDDVDITSAETKAIYDEIKKPIGILQGKSLPKILRQNKYIMNQVLTKRKNS
mgnify:FL=1